MSKLPLSKFLRSKILCVYHHDSPGMRVYVRRNWIQRLYRNASFSAVGERHLHGQELWPLLADAEELAKTFHALYERNAPVFGYTTRPSTRFFNSLSPNGRLMIRVCRDLISGEFRLNPVATQEEALDAAGIIGGLKLLTIEVGIGQTPDEAPVRITLQVVDVPDRRTFTLKTNTEELVFVRADDNPYELTPSETNRIARELAEYLNAQLFGLKSPIRVTMVEFSWNEAEGDIEHVSRLKVEPSVWEKTLSDPRMTQTTMIVRPELIDPK